MARRAPKPEKIPSLPEHVIAHPSELESCLEHLAASTVLGFDTEFVGEDAYRPELCLIQVASAEQLFVIDPFAVGSLEAFWRLILDPDRTTVVHSGREDIRICHYQMGKPPGRIFDVQLAAGLVGLTYPIGYGSLVHDLLGQRMTKAETLTNWRRRPLSPAQLRYAFDDVRYLLPAWKKLADRLKRGKRTGWADEEFSIATQRATADEVATERWRKIKGIGGLDRRGLAVAREIFRWRERLAERVNRPARHLLRDDVLAEIARRNPARHEDLAAFRGVPPRDVTSLLEAVHRAGELSPEEYPNLEARDNDPPHIVLIANLLGVVLADWCAKNRLAANLVGSGADLKAIVRSVVYREPLPELPLTRGWRAEVVLGELMAILSGERAVRIDNPRASAPLEILPFEKSVRNELDS